MTDQWPDWMGAVTQAVLDWRRELVRNAKGLKLCTKCKKVKPLDKFAKHSFNKDKKQYHCKTCGAAWRRDYYARTGR